jgi:Protein of unknown function (DUF3307)
MEILILLFLLQIKHCYADFMIQTYAQTVKKGVYRDWVGITHSLDHVWTSIVALTLFNCIFPISFWSIILVPIVEGIIHYHIDWTKVHFGCKDNTKPLFWAQFGYDQLAHQATYLLMAWFLLVN